MGGHDEESNRAWRKEAYYGSGGCSNWKHVYDHTLWNGGNLCNGCSLQQCVAACNRRSDCFYFGYGGHYHNRCFRMKGQCAVARSNNWQFMYKMVRVEGGWVQTHTISSNSHYETEKGWSKHVSTNIRRATESTVSAGFTVFGSYGTGSVSGSSSVSMSRSTSTDIRRHTLQKIKHHFQIGHGGYLFTWVWRVHPGTEQSRTVTTGFRVQSDVAPNCLPGYQADRKYQNCRSGGQIGHNKPPSCRDKYSNCRHWARWHCHNRYRQWMSQNCPKSCKKCR